MTKGIKRLKEIREGEVWKSNFGGYMVIINYISSTNCTLMFDDGTVVTNKEYYRIKEGVVKNPMIPNVFGVGYLGVGEYKAKVNYKNTEKYNRWHNMMSRCYSNKWVEKYPNYKGCTVDTEWHNFQNFAQWCEDNFKEYMDDTWDLDKDILVKGNKHYSAETCCFVPEKLNSKLKNSNKYFIGDLSEVLGDYKKLLDKRLVERIDYIELNGW